jgi:hypothetical protein
MAAPSACSTPQSVTAPPCWKLVEMLTVEGSGDFGRIIRQLVYDPVDLDEDSRRAIRIITLPGCDEPATSDSC